MRKPDLPVVFVSPTEHLSFIQAAGEREDVYYFIVILFLHKCLRIQTNA